jgi:fumarate reductase subunit C
MTRVGREVTDLHLYRPRVSTWWWTRKRSYFVFVMRELSSIFVAWLVVYLLMFLYAVGRGATAYEDFLDWASTPWVVALNVVALLFLALHVVTWFILTPQAMLVKLGSRPVPAALVIASQYAALLVVSAIVFWLVVR